MTDQPTNPNAALLNGRYRLLAIVAGGGMATVYKAQDILLNRVVAIKMLRERFAQDPLFVQRFREEAQAAANLNHPNIVTIFDVGSDTTNGSPRNYIVMEFVEGQDLKQAIRHRAITGELYAIDDAVDIARQVSEGVGYAHKRGIVHCDIKPQNVIITPEGRAKVADFGIARAYTAMVAERVDVVWGTPQYYSPEQATGAAPTPASDVYSIGVMLFEMLSGRLPFEAKDTRELARMHMTQEPPALHSFNPAVPLQLEAIVRRTLNKDPATRYRDADQLARVLASYLQQGEEQTLRQPVLPPLDQTTGRTGPTRPTSVNRTSQPPARPIIQTPLSDRTTPGAQLTGATGATGATSGRSAAQQGGTDILLWLLAAMVILCVLGLIPLWAGVVRAFNAPVGTSQPIGTTTITFITSTTPTNGLVVVPQLVGLTLPQANQQLTAFGLQARVVEERTDTNSTQAVVLEQRPAQDTQVSAGSFVELVVSKPTKTQNVPSELMGQVLDESLSGMLNTVGWNVVVTESLSFLPERTIIGLDPSAGTKLAVSESLTITVSTGGRINLHVDMSPVIIESARFEQESYVRGQTFRFSVLFKAVSNVGHDYKVFVHVLRQDGNPAEGVVTNADRTPTNNGAVAPTSAWGAGTVVNDVFQVTLPGNLPVGLYRIEVGLYDDQGRMRVIDYGLTEPQPDPVNSVLVRRIRVD